MKEKYVSFGADGTRPLIRQGLDDLYGRFWKGTAEDGHFENYCMVVLWEVTMALLAMDTAYEVVGDEEILVRLKSEWNYLCNLLPEEEMTGPHTACNPACDDAAWSAMCMMLMFRRFGDEKALQLTARLLRNSYTMWQDRATANGLWYRFGDDKTPKLYGWVKSVYCAGLLLSSLQYYETTKGTPYEDHRLLEETLQLADWVEQHLRREGEKNFRGYISRPDDKLYYTDFIDNPETGMFRPAKWGTPDQIAEGDSCCSLFGATGMAAVNVMRYKLFGDKQALERSVSTANALLKTPYNNGGVLLNDRDAWTNAAFMGYFVRDVLSCNGIDAQLIQLFSNTAASIFGLRTCDGLYPAEWSGGDRWTRENITKNDQIKTMGTSLHMAFSGCLAQKLYL